MIVKCVASLPTRDQAKRLGEHFRPGRQEFGVIVGETYLVFSLKMLGGEPWVDIADRDAKPGYLFGAPLCLFEILDPRVPSIWEVGVSENGELKVAPSSFFQRYYHDDLFEGVESIVADFLRVRRQLEAEAALEGSSEGPRTR